MQLAQMQASMTQGLLQPQWPQAYGGGPLLQPLGLGQHAPQSALAPEPTAVAEAAQGCDRAPDHNIQEQHSGEPRHAGHRSFSRSRTPSPQVAPSIPEAPSPEAALCF